MIDLITISSLSDDAFSELKANIEAVLEGELDVKFCGTAFKTYVVVEGLNYQLRELMERIILLGEANES